MEAIDRQHRALGAKVYPFSVLISLEHCVFHSMPALLNSFGWSTIVGDLG